MLTKTQNFGANSIQLSHVRKSFLSALYAYNAKPTINDTAYTRWISIFNQKKLFKIDGA